MFLFLFLFYAYFLSLVFSPLLENWVSLENVGSFLFFIGKLFFLMSIYVLYRVHTGHGNSGKSRNYNTVKFLPGNPGKRIEVVKNHGKFYFFFPDHNKIVVSIYGKWPCNLSTFAFCQTAYELFIFLPAYFVRSNIFPQRGDRLIIVCHFRISKVMDFLSCGQKSHAILGNE